MWSQRLKHLIQRHRSACINLAALALLVVIGIATWFARPPPAPPSKPQADLVVVHKAARRMELYQRGVLLKSYSVSLGSHPIGAKWREGDGKTPEGEYIIDYRKADSAFHRALHISYPEPKDVAVARAHGVGPGEMVMIHGTKNGVTPAGLRLLPHDWTDGCVAVTDREIDEIWQLVPDGTKIILEP